jgi:hypothetical protein
MFPEFLEDLYIAVEDIEYFKGELSRHRNSDLVTLVIVTNHMEARQSDLDNLIKSKLFESNRFRLVSGHYPLLERIKQALE